MFFIDSDCCTNCDCCRDACPCDAITEVDGKYTIDPALCSECAACLDVCEFGAVYEAPLEAIPKKDI